MTRRGGKKTVRAGTEELVGGSEGGGACEELLESPALLICPPLLS